MSKKRGLSAEEKRTRMMEIFFEKKEFFQLKELERLGPKEKGITSMSVKEVVQSLVDDGMVDTDKIGTSIYFWALPSKAVNNRKQKREDLARQLTDCERKQEANKQHLKKVHMGREDSTQRSDVLKALKQKEGEKKKLLEELEVYKECDPDVLKEIELQTKVAHEAANRWTDNIFSLKTWAKRKFGFDEQMIDKNFEIPEDLDYLE